MKPEMKAKILAYNRAIAEKAEKASDLDILMAAFSKLPPGQLKKLLTEEVLEIIRKHGLTL